MKYLKWYNGDFLGIVGETTDMTCEDGSNICIGDLVDINIGNRHEIIGLFVNKDWMTGFKENKFIKGSFVVENLTYTITKHSNEYLESRTKNISIHEATIHDIAVKCEKVEEKISTVKLIQKLNGEDENVVNFSNDLFCNYVILDSIKLTNACDVGYSRLNTKIIINYPTFIKHFDNTKLEVEIKQIDNVVLKRLVKGNGNLIDGLSKTDLWDATTHESFDSATKYINLLKERISKINNLQPKVYDSLGQELHEGDVVEYMIKEAFSQGLLNGKLEMFNGKLTIDKFIALPEEVNSTKFYIRKVVNK